MISVMSYNGYDGYVRRKRTLETIEQLIKEYGWAPSYEEIMAATGIKSKATVHQHLMILEREGKLRLGHGPRMIPLT